MARTRPAGLPAVIACLAITAAGCAAGHQPQPTAQNPPSAPGASSAPAASIRSLAARYLAVAEPANHRLDVEVDAYADHSHHDLAAAEAALRAQAATERQFDRQLAAIAFPPAIDATARALIRVNEIRAGLAVRQAAAPTIAALLSYAGQHRAADAEIEVQVRVLRAELRLPPPQTS